ncbi:MAG TPA: deoxyribodipyrimidine photo-lyase [Bryobacteraceae bacterium]|nr:deoxyribodipyrimidine photo-lyase [Bryobacteraceae bacterium]
MAVEAERIRVLNAKGARKDADYVLYWCQMNRRAESNHALAHAAEIANENGLPLLVYEGLTFGYKAANDRLHTFILEGVSDVASGVKRAGAGYVFHNRATRRQSNNVLYRLAARARCVVTDDYPAFIAAEHNLSVPAKIGVPFIAVDSSCVVPMSVHDKCAYGAYTIRPRIRQRLKDFLRPVATVSVKRRWDPRLLPSDLRNPESPNAAGCDIDHSVAPSISFTGGSAAARKRLKTFLETGLRRYAKDSRQPSLHATSGLSPYLHFGHISSLEVALAVRDYAKEHRLIADEFLEQLIVRRELAFNFARFTSDVESLGSLPEWCKKTMSKHAADARAYTYTPGQLERAETHDALWNACQKELLIRGTIHGYYRMYWGKKIMEWSPTYGQALKVMIHLHDVYALDGRDPNTYANILWCFGLHDRPWAERPVFGQIRYMSLDGMRRKTDVAAYTSEIAELERRGKDRWRL